MQHIATTSHLHWFLHFFLKLLALSILTTTVIGSLVAPHQAIRRRYRGMDRKKVLN